jgi:hypothetical protein
MGGCRSRYEPHLIVRVEVSVANAAFTKALGMSIAE